MVGQPTSRPADRQLRRLSVKQNLLLQSAKGDEAKAIELAADAFPILGQRINQQAGTLSGGPGLRMGG